MKTAMAAEINLTNIIEIVGFGLAAVRIYVLMQVQAKEQEMKLRALEDRVTKTEQEDHNLYKKLEQIMTMLTEIKVELKEKQDRQ